MWKLCILVMLLSSCIGLPVERLTQPPLNCEDLGNISGYAPPNDPYLAEQAVFIEARKMGASHVFYRDDQFQLNDTRGNLMIQLKARAYACF